MIDVRRSAVRGDFDHGWLDTRHTFSFGDYHDPRFMGVGPLRVINEDRVQPGAGFPTHSHRDMEILTLVLEGALEHRDSMGNHSVIVPGELQRMTAGRGVTHSEFNQSRIDRVHFLQIWIVPERQGLEPSYEQRSFPDAERRGRLALVASHDGRDGSLTVHQDVSVFDALLDRDQAIEHRLAPGRRAWLQVARGEVRLDGGAPDEGVVLRAGDGATVSDQPALAIAATDPSEIVLFDLP